MSFNRMKIRHFLPYLLFHSQIYYSNAIFIISTFMNSTQGFNHLLISPARNERYNYNTIIFVKGEIFHTQVLFQG
jgi:hypothetical protein